MNSEMIARERVAAIQWARELLGRRHWVILDTETTGLGPQAEVCQIGVLAPNGRTLLDALLRPYGPIAPDATAIHGIEDREVDNSPLFTLIAPFLGDLIDGQEVVVFNAPYDYRILAQTCELLHVDPDKALHTGGPWTCAMLQYARFVGEWNDYRQSFRWQKLPPIPGETAHSAIADCRATLALIHRMAEAQP